MRRCRPAEAPRLLDTLPRTIDIRVVQEGRVLAITPEFPAIPLDLPTGRSQRMAHDVLVASLNLGGRVATAQLASDVLGVVNPLRAYLRSLAVSVPAAAALAGLLGFVLAGRLLRPLERLGAAAAAVGRGGNLRAPLPGAGQADELGRLAGLLQTAFHQVAEVREREETFTAAAAHDLRSPLAALKTRLQGSLAAPRSGAELREDMAEALKDVDRVRHLTEQLLTLARGERDLRFQTVDLARLAGEAVDRAREQLPDVQLDFEGVGPAAVRGEEALLTPLLDNLIGNGLRHGGGRAMRVAVLQLPEHVRLSVSDAGPGVPDAALSHLTEPFYRVSAARGGEGHGLGLTIVSHVARIHGASLRFGPASPSGLQVTVDFPRPGAADVLGWEPPGT